MSVPGCGTLNNMLTVPMKRLTRPDTPSRSFRITERDVAIVRAVARWRFMSSDQVVRYLTSLDSTTSAQQVSRRLAHLFYRNFLDRPPHQHLQLSSFSHLIYGLGREGARLLAESGGDVDAHVQWTTKNARATSAFLLHTLETAEAMLHFEAACRERTDLRLLDHHDLLSYFPAATRELDDPFRLRVSVQQDFKPLALNVIPDRLFSILVPDNHRHNFCLEIDRSTMSVAARRLTGKSSFARKITAYFAAWEQDRHVHQWDMRGFRVLSVVPSEKRIHNMLAVQRSITGDRLAALFLYCTPERIAAHGPLAPIWISSESDNVALLERK